MKKIFSVLLGAMVAFGFTSCEPSEATVEVEIESVSLDKATLSLEVEETYTFEAEVLPENAKDKTLEWKSSDDKVAVVTQGGLVVAVADGEATITVSSVANPNLTDECVVTVGDSENPDGPDVTEGMLLADIDADDLPADDTWVFVDKEVKSGVRDIKVDANGEPVVTDDGTYTILGDGDFKPLWDALFEAEREGREITVELPNLTSIPCYAFFDIQLYNYDMGAEDFKGKVPTSLVGVSAESATEIGRGAFRETYSLLSVELPEVEVVSSLAFRMASSLTAVNFPKAVTVEDGAFGFCGDIATAKLPKVTKIGSNAFYFCDGLQSMSLPEVTELEMQAFRGCDNMVKFLAPKLETVGEGVFAFCQNLSEVDFSSVKSIGSMSFYNCTRLTKLEMPELTTISKMALYYCYTINTVKFPKLANLGEEAFGWCSALEFATLATESSSITANALAFNNITTANIHLKTGTENGSSINENMWTVDGNEFGPFKSINDADIPDEPFGKSYTLATIPTNGASIDSDIWIITDETSSGPEAFARLRTALVTAGRAVSVEFPNITSLPEGALLDVNNGGLTNLSAVSAPVLKAVAARVFYDCKILKTVEIPEVTSVGEFAFGNCISLSALNLPKVKSIMGGAFYKCSKLSSIVVNASYYHFEDKVLYNADKTFLHTFLTSNTAASFTAPESVTEVGAYAFMENATIKTLDFPSAENFCERAFMSCMALESFYAPKAISFETYVFQKCKKMSSVSLPRATTFGEAVFTECNALSTITLPKAEFIGKYAFFVCGGLKTVILPEATELDYGAFYSCYNLVSVDLPKVVKVGTKAFEQCGAIESISLPMAEEFGDECFSFCSKMTSIELPKASIIGDRIFTYCNLMTKVTIATESNIESISTTVFNGTTKDKIDFVTGLDNGTTIDDLERTWTIGDIVYGPFKSVTAK